MTERVAGAAKQGFWFGFGSSTVCLTVDVLGPVIWGNDTDATDNYLEGTDVPIFIGVLQDYGTVIWTDAPSEDQLLFIMENCKFELTAAGAMPEAIKTEIEAEALARTGRVFDFRADSGAWYPSTRTAGLAAGTGAIANIATHS